MEFVEEFLTEGRVFRGARVDGRHQFGTQGFEIATLQAHQVDKTRVPFHFRTREKRLQCIEKALFFCCTTHCKKRKKAPGCNTPFLSA